MTNNPPAHRRENPFDGVADEIGGRRSFLQWGGAGIAAATFGSSHNDGGSDDASKRRATLRLVRQFLHAIESGSTSAIWDLFARDGAIEFPFLGTRYTVLPGLTFTDLHVEFLDDPEALIAKYKGHAVVTFTGKPYDQTYISEIHTRNGKITSSAEYFDTAVLNEAFTP
jgi:ketosteroid isomerase-like protein